MEDLLQQTCHDAGRLSEELWLTSDGSKWFTFDIFLPNQFVKDMYSLNFYNLSYFCVM